MFDDSKERTWVWCLVGNIIERHPFGESKEILTGSKHFRPGAKVYVSRIIWGDGFERIAVIGRPRKQKNYIEVVMRTEHIENFRIQKVYTPFLLKMMAESDYSWWNNSDDAQRHILSLIESIYTHRKNGQ